MQTRCSLFSHTVNCPDIENRILFYLPMEDLHLCAKVSKAWCRALDSIMQPYLAFSQISLTKALKKTSLSSRQSSVEEELESISNYIYLGLYANMTLYRLGLSTFDKIEKSADFLNHQLDDFIPWWNLALGSIDNNDPGLTEFICQKKIRTIFKNENYISKIIEKFCNKNKFKDAIYFYKKYYVGLYHSPIAMQNSLEMIKQSIQAQKNSPYLSYLIKQIDLLEKEC
jgi:F-box associated protein